MWTDCSHTVMNVLVLLVDRVHLLRQRTMSNGRFTGRRMLSAHIINRADTHVKVLATLMWDILYCTNAECRFRLRPCAHQMIEPMRLAYFKCNTHQQSMFHLCAYRYACMHARIYPIVVGDAEASNGERDHQVIHHIAHNQPIPPPRTLLALLHTRTEGTDDSLHT